MRREGLYSFESVYLLVRIPNLMPRSAQTFCSLFIPQPFGVRWAGWLSPCVTLTHVDVCVCSECEMKTPLLSPRPQGPTNYPKAAQELPHPPHYQTLITRIFLCKSGHRLLPCSRTNPREVVNVCMCLQFMCFHLMKPLVLSKKLFKKLSSYFHHSKAWSNSSARGGRVMVAESSLSWRVLPGSRHAGDVRPLAPAVGLCSVFINQWWNDGSSDLQFRFVHSPAVRKSSKQLMFLSILSQSCLFSAESWDFFFSFYFFLACLTLVVNTSRAPTSHPHSLLPLESFLQAGGLQC